MIIITFLVLYQDNHNSQNKKYYGNYVSLSGQTKMLWEL